METTTVTLDFWNTLYCDPSEHEEEKHKLREKIIIGGLRGVSSKLDRRSICDAYKKANEFADLQWESSIQTVGMSERLKWMCKYLQITWAPNKDFFEKLALELDEVTLIYPPRSIGNSLETIRKLSKKYKLAIISDTGQSSGSTLRKIMRNDGILSCFSAFGFSDELASCKPNKRVFENVSDFIKSTPQQSVHVGDTIRTDIMGAIHYGSKAIHISSMPFVDLVDNPLYFQIQSVDELPNLLGLQTTIQDSFL